MILCDFEDLNKEDFHFKFFETVVKGDIDIITQILKHRTLSKQFDVSYNHYYCIIASIFNAQQEDNCHLELIKLFTQSSLLRKHAKPSLCSKDDMFGGALGNAIIFTPIETVRFLGKFFDDKTSNLQDLITLAAFNNRKEAFFYLVEERKFSIKKPELFVKALVNFPHVDSDIVNYIHHALKIAQSTTHKDNIIGQDNCSYKSSDNHSNKNSNKKLSHNRFSKNKPLSNETILLSVANLKRKNSVERHYWGSKFKQNF